MKIIKILLLCLVLASCASMPKNKNTFNTISDIIVCDNDTIIFTNSNSALSEEDIKSIVTSIYRTSKQECPKLSEFNTIDVIILGADRRGTLNNTYLIAGTKYSYEHRSFSMNVQFKNTTQLNSTIKVYQ